MGVVIDGHSELVKGSFLSLFDCTYSKFSFHSIFCLRQGMDWGVNKIDTFTHIHYT